jgi:hypothetical protein
MKRTMATTPSREFPTTRPHLIKNGCSGRAICVGEEHHPSGFDWARVIPKIIDHSRKALRDGP